MFLKKFDIVSPPITLYYKGDSMHSSIFSGILTIIVYIIIFIFGIYYALEFIHKKNPTAFFFNKYVEDAGIFPLNASSLFHYIQLRTTLESAEDSIDFNSVRIVGIQDITIDNFPSTNLESSPHWIYGLCNNTTDTKGIGYLMTSETYLNCACIRKYYKPDTKKYYDTQSKDFVWPILAHGMSNQNKKFYGLIVEKCKNDNLRTLSGLGSCNDNKVIESYVYSHVISLYLIDQFSDVLNYKRPFSKYLYQISNMLFPKSYTVNNINLNPSLIKSHNGIFFDNVVEEVSYFFSQNEKVTMEDEGSEILDEEGNPTYDEEGNKMVEYTNIVSSFYFWMQNRLQYYERNYKRLQDVLSNIGGLSRVVLIAAILINTLVSNYIILLDTEEMALSLEKNEKAKISRIRPTIYNKINLLIHPPKKKHNYNRNTNYNNYANNFQFSSNMNRLMNDDIDIYQNTYINNENNQNGKYKYIITKRNNYINKKNSDKVKREYNEENKIERINRNNSQRSYDSTGKNDAIKSIRNIKSLKNEELLDKPTEKQHFNWFQYFKYMIYCTNKNKAISYYEEFRAKILSEENLIQNYLDLCQLFKFLESKEKSESIVKNKLNQK